MAGTLEINITQRLVDTRPLWPAATKTKDLEHVAARALNLLTSEERGKVLKFYFLADAKMALVSHLLKHWIVCTTCAISWSETHLTRDDKGKPIFVLDSTSGGGGGGGGGSSSSSSNARQPVTFNVSHQAGLVSLVAASQAGDNSSSSGAKAEPDVGSLVDVGTDIVCTSERRDRDHKVVREKGWAEFVDMHADVFGRAEVQHLKHGDLLLGGPANDDDNRDATVVDAKLRAFYALWCYREAYVKMTGEALLASWLNDLEFKGFRAPEKGGGVSSSEFSQVGQPEAQVIRDCEILLKGQRVDDANVCLRSLGADYMTCSAVRTPSDKQVGRSLDLGPYEWLSLEEILEDAEMAGGR